MTAFPACALPRASPRSLGAPPHASAFSASARACVRLTASPARTAVLAPLHCARSSSRVAYGVPSARRDIRRS
eukprot:4357892-Alexandrium_andersonii.AAC.1